MFGSISEHILSVVMQQSKLPCYLSMQANAHLLSANKYTQQLYQTAPWATWWHDAKWFHTHLPTAFAHINASSPRDWPKEYDSLQSFIQLPQAQFGSPPLPLWIKVLSYCFYFVEPAYFRMHDFWHSSPLPQWIVNLQRQPIYQYDQSYHSWANYETALRLLMGNEQNLTCAPLPYRDRTGVYCDSPLGYAAQSNAIAVAKLLIARGAQNTTPPNSSNSPLHVAVSRGRAEMVKLLLKNGAYVNALNSANKSPAVYAICHKPPVAIELLTILLRRKPSLNTLQPLIGLAIEHNQPRTVLLLLQHGAPYALDKVLHWIACLNVEKGQSVDNEQPMVDLLEWLMQQGRDLNLANAEGNTALHLVVSQKRKTNRIQRITWLIAHTSINTINKKGQTPLHLALQQQYTDAAALLLEAGADVRTQDGTILHTLVVQQQAVLIPVAIRLLPSLAHATTVYGETALHLAAANGSESCIDPLLDAKVAINAADLNGWTALHIAAVLPNVQCVKKLLAKGANILLQDKNGFTALHRAAAAGQWENIKLLLQHDLRVLSIRAHDNATAQDLANKAGNRQIANWLALTRLKNPSAQSTTIKPLLLVWNKQRTTASKTVAHYKGSCVAWRRRVLTPPAP